MPKVIISLDEVWPVYSVGRLPDGLSGIDVSEETYRRWMAAATAYRTMQSELGDLYRKQEEDGWSE
jgi:hypothetical protein